MEQFLPVAAAIPSIAGLVGLWLRLRWRIRRDKVRGRALVELAGALRGGGRLDELHPDGSRVTLVVSPTSAPRV